MSEAPPCAPPRTAKGKLTTSCVDGAPNPKHVVLPSDPSSICSQTGRKSDGVTGGWGNAPLTVDVTLSA